MARSYKKQTGLVEPHELIEYLPDLVLLQRECAANGYNWREVLVLAHMGRVDALYAAIGNEDGRAAEVMGTMRAMRNGLTGEVGRIPTIIPSHDAEATRYDVSTVDWYYMAVGPCCWGRASSINTARRLCQRNKPSYVKAGKYLYFRVTADARIDQMGTVTATRVEPVTAKGIPFPSEEK